MSGAPRPSFKSKQFYEMFRSNSQILRKVGAPADQPKEDTRDIEAENKAKLDALLAKKAADKEAAAAAAAAAEAEAKAKKDADVAVAPPAPVEETKPVEDIQAPPIPATATSEDAEKEVRELSKIMELSLAENEELARKMAELEAKLLRLENRATETEAVAQRRSGKGMDFRQRPPSGKYEPVKPLDSPKTPTTTAPVAATPAAAPAPAPVAAAPVTPAAAPAVSPLSDSKKTVTLNETTPAKRPVFSKKFNTQAYYEMFRSRSRILLEKPPVENKKKSSLAQTFGYGAEDENAPAATETKPVEETKAVVEEPAPMVIPTIVEPVAEEPSKPAPIPVEISREDAVSEVKELNNIVVQSLEETAVLQQQVEYLKGEVQRLTALVNAPQEDNLVSLVQKFLESNGAERAQLLNLYPALTESIAYFDGLREQSRLAAKSRKSHKSSKKERKSQKAAEEASRALAEAASNQHEKKEKKEKKERKEKKEKKSKKNLEIPN